MLMTLFFHETTDWKIEDRWECILYVKYSLVPPSLFQCILHMLSSLPVRPVPDQTLFYKFSEVAQETCQAPKHSLKKPVELILH